jgi:hypothetical protein
MSNEQPRDDSVKPLDGAFEIEIVEDVMDILDHPIIGNN